MRTYQWMKAYFLAAYLMILFPGWFIAMPLGICLISWCIEPDLSLRLSGIGALLGLLAIIFNRKIFSNKMYVDIIGFAMLSLPLVRGLVVFPKVLGGFNGFYIPASLFVIFFVVYLAIKYRRI